MLLLMVDCIEIAMVKGPGQTRTNYKGKINLINEKDHIPIM